MNNTSSVADFLIEVGAEELPANQLEKLRDSFTLSLKKQLEINGLTFESTQSFITPRRLAVFVSQLSMQQPTQKILRKGPAKTAAFDEKGNPTKAALGFAASCSVPFEMLTLQETEQGAWFVFEQTKTGESTEKLLSTLLTEAFKNLPLGRQMRWGSNNYSFLRPIHWIVLLLGNKTIECELFGIKSSNVTYGHRFHAPQPIVISTARDYEALLETKGHVIPNFEKRREKISIALMKAAPQNTFINNELLDEVTGIVEWPVILTGQFDPEFLKVPQEVLITSMQNHQKCFPIGDKNHKLLPQFLIVSNIDSTDPAQVIAGNESVIHARLADAAFYYEVDKKTSLTYFRNDLKQVRFQQGLGSIWDKTDRLTKLSKIIAEKIDANVGHTMRAAELCKSDLLTQMVGEFPELQGTMGYYYALNDNEPKAIAKAIQEHYIPRTANDPLPGDFSKEGCAVALADRIDTIVGLFGIGKKPTGDKDPYSLRRQTVAILKILTEKKLDLDLEFLLNSAKSYYELSFTEPNLIQSILDYCFERARSHYQELGIKPQIFEAVFANRVTNPLDFHMRMDAVNEFIKLSESESLTAANKRVKNILAKTESAIPKDSAVQIALLQEEAEKSLENHLSIKEKELKTLLQNRNYKEALRSLADLREPIDYFFDKVMVMVEDEGLRNNRLRLLNRLRELFLTIADISLL